jgi:hypothetical protein
LCIFYNATVKKKASFAFASNCQHADLVTIASLTRDQHSRTVNAELRIQPHQSGATACFIIK